LVGAIEDSGWREIAKGQSNNILFGAG
jgi:hypothetical protein